MSTGALAIIYSARHRRVITTRRTLRVSRQHVIVSRRHHTTSFIRGPLLACLRPATSSASRLMARLMRCTNIPMGLSGTRTANVCTNVMLSAGGFVRRAKTHAFRTTTFLHHTKTSVSEIGRLFVRAFSSVRLHTGVMFRTDHARKVTVSMTPRNLGSVVTLTTRDTSVLVDGRSVRTTFMLCSLGSNNVNIDTQSGNGMGMRIMVRTLNNNNREAITNTRLRNVAVRRTGRTVLRRTLGTLRSTRRRRRWR